MMIGITNWQQQVPLPQKYTGSNAWRIPRLPLPSPNPTSIKGRFLRGAIAIAANGIPIFNPQNNRGEISAEIGELDQWGGHCGRADDYHYHAAPLHLQSTVGTENPIAYALDGYPIMGLAEQDGSAPKNLDAFNGHASNDGGYHYHASTKYPYVNGGFHGVVSEKDGQVDPQPRAQPIRESLSPLRGAKITGFESNGKNQYKLTFELNSQKRAVWYSLNDDGTTSFEFQNGRDGATRQTYPQAHNAGGGSDPEKSPPKPQSAQKPERPQQPNRPPERPRPPGQAPANASIQTNPAMAGVPRSPTFLLTSPALGTSGELPQEYTGDGPGSTLPLDWMGAPAGTKSYALVMHHLDPEGNTKWYWILYNIPPSVHSLAKNTKDVGVLGSSFRGEVGYEPPHSKGPGAKTYVLTLFALSSELEFSQPASKVDFVTIMAAMQGKILAGSDLSVTYTRTANSSPPPPRPPPSRQ